MNDTRRLTAVPVGTSPNGVVLNASGSVAYVANADSNTVSVVNTSTGAVANTWKFGTGFLDSPIDGIFYSNVSRPTSR